MANTMIEAGIEPEYNKIVAVVKAGGERFYVNKESVERYQKRLEAITPKYRASAGPGDRLLWVLKPSALISRADAVTMLTGTSTEKPYG